MSRISRMIGATLLALTVTFTATACGGETAKPSKEEIRAVWTEQLGEPVPGLDADQTTKLIDCMVDEYHANLSPEALRAIVDKNDSFEPSAQDQKALEAATSKCMQQYIQVAE